MKPLIGSRLQEIGKIVYKHPTHKTPVIPGVIIHLGCRHYTQWMLKSLARKALAHTNSEILKSVLRTQEDKKILKARRDFYRQFLQKGDLYFDVGANYGNRIEPLINEGIRIVAVEPQLKCLKYLNRKYGGRINIVPRGLGSEQGSLTMFIADANVLTSFSREWIQSARESGRFEGYDWNNEREVAITTLDELIKTYGKPQFIKIDVEGFEYEVLKGLSQPVNALSFEYAIPEQREVIIDCIHYLAARGKDGDIRFNYSIGESMEWAMDKWLAPEEMLLEIDTAAFINSDFGDIYAQYSAR